ncbi:MAG TPA: phage terminase small subunit P27 family [Burkholderiaceae bacterium]|nr:phage terminase small subunit P27 family [Burkholderiaceae bacterium]
MARPRKPTALKLVTGTQRADRANGAEPEPLLVTAEQASTPPAHLHERSAAVWREIAPMLRSIQLLTVADLIELEMLCDAVADYRYTRAARGDDYVAHSPKTGSPMVDPWHIVQQMAGKRVDELGSKFGLNPQARSRLMINPQGDLFGSQAGQPEQAASGPGRFFK